MCSRVQINWRIGEIEEYTFRKDQRGWDKCIEGCLHQHTGRRIRKFLIYLLENRNFVRSGGHNLMNLLKFNRNNLTFQGADIVSHSRATH